MMSRKTVEEHWDKYVAKLWKFCGHNKSKNEDNPKMFNFLWPLECLDSKGDFLLYWSKSDENRLKYGWAKMD